MIFNLALLSNLLLASGALAVPSSRLGDRLARRDKIHQSQPLSRVASSAPLTPVVGNANWAGIVLSDSNGTFSVVSATFTVPYITGADGSGSVWVGIDGTLACPAILQAGIDFTITQNQVQYGAWYEWFLEDASMPFPGIDIHPGDVISAAVAADNATFGMAIIENQTTGQTVYTDLQGSPSTALCGGSAEWIVEDFLQDNVLVPLANFSSVTFSDTYATGPDRIIRNSSNPDAWIADIVQNGTVLTIVDPLSGGGFIVQYIKGEAL